MKFPSGFSPYELQLPKPITSFGWHLPEVAMISKEAEVRLLAIEAVPMTPQLRDYQPRQLEITADRIISLRVSDEADLLHYWTVRDEEEIDPKTSIYKIEQSSYLDEMRGASILPWSDELIHLMIAGEDRCVEIIAEPELRIRLVELNNRKLN